MSPDRHPLVATFLDLPAGSPGGSVELFLDLYTGEEPLIPARAFMLAPAGPRPRTPPGLDLLSTTGKCLEGPAFHRYVAHLRQALTAAINPSQIDVLHLHHLAFGATPALIRALPAHPRTALVQDTNTGRLQWVNAGHPAPVLIREHRVMGRLDSPTTLPVGFGGAQPQVSEVTLTPGDRILCFTDGLVEEHESGQEQFGEDQLIDWVNQLEKADRGIRAVARDLSHTLKRARGEPPRTTPLSSWSSGVADPPPCPNVPADAVNSGDLGLSTVRAFLAAPVRPADRVGSGFLRQ
ncbi:PP2C family protein-serine/threonine phosphatase [Streptomyces anulatus]|uniref:PP2C family protein-serine/threonine phosphatase n=1 Tax=Streptomyces anulatus TaxID=1892 RepID=UPI0027E357C7|nr:PP2C family protein-serine/threonine phosphatase [Streptomyces anulatus]